MFIIFLLLSYAGTYFALRKLVGDAFSTFRTISTTCILSPMLVFVAALLTELISGRNLGFGGVFLMAGIGLPLAVLAGVALFLDGIVEWVRLGLKPTIQNPPVEDLLCSQCGHTAAQHRIAPQRLTCVVHGCNCIVFVDELQNGRF